MNEATRSALVALNRRFYARHAESFSASRERPWKGWERILRRLEPPAGEPLRVLDVGCGNGRLASHLGRRFPGPIHYHGADASRELLAAARRRLAGLASDGAVDGRLFELDVTRCHQRHPAGGGRYDLIALFGLLHHLPGGDGRRRLLASLAPRVDRRGLLAASLWRFDRGARWAAKTLPWEEYNRRAPTPIDLAELEPGDHLLTWAGDRQTPRYCHLFDDAETAELAAAVGLPCIDVFAADGPGDDRNCYLLFGTSAAPHPPLPAAAARLC